MNKNSLIYTIIFSFIITFTFVFGLSLSHNLTKDQISAYKELSEKKKILTAFGYDTISDKEIANSFKKMITTTDYQSQKIYSTVVFTKKGELKIYGKIFSGPGLWGTITGIITMTEDAKQIYGFEILTHNETPGLGGRIEELWFLDQFKQETIGQNGIKLRRDGITPGGDTDKNNSSFDTITGATQTSTFLQKIINTEVSKLQKIVGELHE